MDARRLLRDVQLGSDLAVGSASRDERIAVLKGIIGFERFEDVSRRVHEETLLCDNTLDSLRRQIGTLQPVSAEELSAAQDAVVAAEESRKDAQAHLTAAVQRIEQARQWHGLEAKRAALEEQLTAARQRAANAATIRADKVRLDELDLRLWSPAVLRQQIGVVPQEVQLFSGTIAENIALGAVDRQFERVVAAAKFVGAHDFIQRLPAGYDTALGERGGGLSAGQRQLISIARALIRNPRLLVLDEATSALDSFSEREIQKNLESILADKTAFIIAHKIATVRDADHILVLHDGAIVEQGKHDELIAKKGTYYYLAAQQLNL